MDCRLDEEALQRNEGQIESSQSPFSTSTLLDLICQISLLHHRCSPLSSIPLSQVV